MINRRNDNKEIDHYDYRRTCRCDSGGNDAAASTKFRTKTTGTDSSYRMVGNALSEILFLSDP